jgi:integrase
MVAKLVATLSNNQTPKMATDNRKRISLDNVKKLEPGGVIWDIDVTGFTVRCQQRAKVYGLKYRYGGRQRWYSIGRHGAPWTPEMARKEARRLLGLVASGIDPAAAKTKQRASPTLREISERFMSEHVEAKQSIAAIRLLLFTGARLSEILGLEWDWVDFDRGEARLPDSKTGAKTVQLPAPALEVLASLPRLDGNPYVISGRRTGAHLVNVGKPWRRIRKAAGLDGLRIHDLRHAFAGIAASSGMGLPIIGKMLGHAQPATTARYAHVAPDPVKQAAAAVAETIAAAMRGKAGEVVPISERAKRL